MDDLFRMKLFIQIFSIGLSFALALTGVLSVIKRANRRRPSCIYFAFLSCFYFLYRLVDFVNLYRLPQEFIVSLYSSLLFISSLMFLNLYQVAHLREEIGDRDVSKTNSETRRRQKQLKISDRVFNTSLYLTILIVFLMIGLNPTLKSNFLSVIATMTVLLITVGMNLSCRRQSKKSKGLYACFLLFLICNFLSFLFMILHNDFKIYLYFQNRKIAIVLLEALTISFRMFVEASLIPLLVYKIRRIR